MTESAKLRLPYIAASQAQKHVTHNEALTLLDTLCQASVIDKDLSAPPMSPAEGDCYIVAATGTGDWTGWDNRIARLIDGEWRSYLPGAGAGEGWLVYVQDEDALYVFSGSAWQQLYITSSIVVPGGRLTNSTGVPVPAADVAAAGTIYYAPYVHQWVPLYDGGKFVPTDIGGELSQALSDTAKSPAAAANNSNYDLFVWNDAGTLRCTRGPAWSSATARGTGAGTTELERVKGIWLNKIAIANGPAAQRGTYVGTIRTNGSAQVDLKFGSKAALGGTASIGVWNLYNRVPVGGMIMDDTNSWTYSSTWRPLNGDSGNTNNRLDLIRGLAEDLISFNVGILVTNPAGRAGHVGVGVGSTTVNSGTSMETTVSASNTIMSSWRGIGGIGWRSIYALEHCQGSSGNVTFYGDNGAAGNAFQSGVAYETRY